MINAILIIVILAAVVFGIYKHYQSLGMDTNDIDEMKDDDDEIVDLDYLVKETTYAFSRTLKKNINDDNLTKQEYIRKQQRTSALRKAITDASYGDEQAKNIIKNNIRDLISDDEYDINEKSMNEIISFNDSKRITSQQKFEIVLFMYNKEFGRDGFSQLMKDWNLTAPIKKGSEVYYKVSKEQMSEIYEVLVNGKDTEDECSLTQKGLSFNDKLEILAQAIFERYIGLGAVDMLMATDIDGIDAGASGVSKDGYVVKTKEVELPYSYESIYIAYHGVNIHMECMTFGSQKELIRVCDNIYKYDAQEVLSRSKGAVVGSMRNGSRIVVCRPPFADSYSFFYRSFASTPSIKADKLVRDKNKAIPICMMKWFIKGQRNIAITGAQSTGKTTLLKSLLRFIDASLNIRIQELKFELNLRFAYPDRQIVTFQETPSMDAQSGLNIQKKTNGSVNIIGEVANAIQASHIIQTSMVASLFSMFTHHAKTAENLIEAISNNLLECKLYDNKKDAVAMTAKVLNVDCHLANVKGNRHIERITEIIPVVEEEYPSEELELRDGRDKILADTPEYYKRVTNPVQYRTLDIVKRNPLLDEQGKVLKEEDGTDAGVFVLENMPSDEMLNDIMTKLTVDEENEFRYDLQMMSRLSNGEDSKEVDRWIQHILS